MFFDQYCHDELLLAAQSPFNEMSFASRPENYCDGTPTHTEDGIPIRKLYVTNLPAKTTRRELFNVFAPYGFIKSCWVKMSDQQNHQKPSGGTYAFVTFVEPGDAHSALKAPSHEKYLRGNELKTFPADSWHQPFEDQHGNVMWNNRAVQKPTSDANKNNETAQESSSTTQNRPEQGESSTAVEVLEPSPSSEQVYTLLDVLNRDCLHHIMSYVPLCDLIQTERASKRWRDAVHDYIAGLREFKTQWWPHARMDLTTAVLRELLKRLGPSLTKLHLNHPWSALNDRTAHTIGKFCPNLEELEVVGMFTKNWNPLVYGCSNLRSVSFISCNKLADTNLTQLLKNNNTIEQLTIANNSHVTGLFLAGISKHNKIHSLTFFCCYSLQGTVVAAALDSLQNLTTLKLDQGSESIWKCIPTILSKLPHLQELSLSEFVLTEHNHPIENFCNALKNMKELKSLDMHRNLFVSDEVLVTVGQTCHKLRSLNVSSCYAHKAVPDSGVGDKGVKAISKGCTELREIDLSYLWQVTDSGIASLASLSSLRSLTIHGHNTVTTEPFTKCLQACKGLQVMDVSGCDCISEGLVDAAVTALNNRETPLVLHVAGTSVNAAEQQQELPTHKLLILNTDDDRSNPHWRPDFIDRLLHFDITDDAFNDPYDPEDLDYDFEESDDDDDFNGFFDDYDDDDDDVLVYGLDWQLNLPNILLL